MINVYVFSEEKAWSKKLKNKELFFREICKAFPKKYKFISKKVSFSVFKNSAENAVYNISKNFKPSNKNLRYLITDNRNRIIKNSYNLEVLLSNIDWKKI